MAADGAAFAVDGDAGEIAHMLIGAGQLVEKGGLAAVLVAGQGKGEGRAVGQRILVGLDVVFAVFTQTGMGAVAAQGVACGGRRMGLDGPDADLGGVGQAQGQLVAVDAQFHGIAHGRVFDQRDLGAGDDPHVKKMLAQGAGAADCGDDTALPQFQLF